MSKIFLPILGLAGLSLVVAGCGGRDYTGDQRYPLTGSVTFDGEPVDLGSISFIPSGGSRASGGVIENGKFEVPEANGPNAGTHRVEIRWNKQTGKQLRDPDTEEMYDERVEALPPRFHKDSQLTVDVPAPGNKYDFDLKSE